MEVVLARLIALAVRPVVAASLLREPPVVLSSESVDVQSLSEEAGRLSVPSPFELAVVPLGEDAKAFSANVLMHCDQAEAEPLGELYDRFLGSIDGFVLGSEGEWDVSRLEENENVHYRLRYSPGENSCLLTVQFLLPRLNAADTDRWMSVLSG